MRPSPSTVARAVYYLLAIGSLTYLSAQYPIGLAWTALLILKLLFTWAMYWPTQQDNDQ